MKPGPGMSGKQEKTAQAGGSDFHGANFLLLLCLSFSYNLWPHGLHAL